MCYDSDYTIKHMCIPMPVIVCVCICLDTGYLDFYLLLDRGMQLDLSMALVVLGRLVVNRIT